MELSGLLQKIAEKKRQAITAIASLIILSLASAGVLNFYPEFFELFENPLIYIAIAIGGLVALNLLFWYGPELFKGAGKKMAMEKAVVKKAPNEGEIRDVLVVMDNLLAKLPEEEIDRFMKTRDAELYKRAMEKYGVE